MSFFISRITIGLVFLLPMIILMTLGLTSPDEADGWYYFVGFIVTFVFYIVLTRTNLIGQKARKTDEGDIVPDDNSSKE